MKNSTVRRIALHASRWSGLQAALRLRSIGPTVLFYHGVEDKIINPWIQQIHMPMRDFEKQVSFLRRYREVISLDYLYECVVNGYLLSPSQVVLTFDDGYKNNAHIVAPLLKAHDLEFTVFISTRHIGSQLRFPTYRLRAAVVFTERKQIDLPTLGKQFDIGTWDSRCAAYEKIVQLLKKAPQALVERSVKELVSHVSPERWLEIDNQFSSDAPMDWDDVRQLRRYGATIGSHCHDHCILHGQQETAEIESQVTQSKKCAERELGTCEYFAYPNGTVGDITAWAYRCIQANGYKMAFTTISGQVTSSIDPWLTPRIGAPFDFEEFRYMLSSAFRENRHYVEACMNFRKACLQQGQMFPPAKSADDVR